MQINKKSNKPRKEQKMNTWDDKIIYSDEQNELVGILMRQTTYDFETAGNKMRQHNWQVKFAISEYLHDAESDVADVPETKKEPLSGSVSVKTPSLNQKIFKEIRTRLDESAKVFNAKQEEKLRLELKK